MTRIRQWLVSIAMAAVLVLSFASVASADPGDHGFGSKSVRATSADPGDTGWGGW